MAITEKGQLFIIYNKYTIQYEWVKSYENTRFHIIFSMQNNILSKHFLWLRKLKSILKSHISRFRQGKHCLTVVFPLGCFDCAEPKIHVFLCPLYLQPQSHIFALAITFAQLGFAFLFFPLQEEIVG